MTVSRVNCNNVNTSFYKCINTFHHICCHTYCSTTTKTTCSIFTCVRIVTHVVDIFRCNQTYQTTFFIYDRQFLDTVFPQNLFCFQKRSTDFSCHEVIFCHHLAHFCFVWSKIFQVAVCDDTNKTIVVIHHRQSADTIFMKQSLAVEQCAICSQSHRISDHTTFIAFHQIHFCSLFLDAHVFMDKTKTTFASNCNRQSRFCNSIHSRTHKRNIQLDITSQMCFKTNL